MNATFNQDVGRSTFSFSAKDVECINGYLKANRGDINKVFHCVWEDPECFGHMGREAATSVLDLIVRVKNGEKFPPPDQFLHIEDL